MERNIAMADFFALKDCALITIATGERVHNLRELRDRLMKTERGIMYYHFWDAILRPRFVDPEYQNDFAAWAYHELHDRRLAEKLAIINPTDYEFMDDLRQKLIDVIEERMDELGFVPVAEVAHPFFFIRSQIVVFDTNIRVSTPEELSESIPRISVSSIFYHFIDSRRRTASGKDDFSEWLLSFGPECASLAEEIASIDPYFNTLLELRDQLSLVFARYLGKGGAE